ncbi:hypothetical protein [uncultured Azohydromonas sp.]|uniref:hypothetical protein n=1 Tax=uncultured Azohydromonas sp. TaxID=487342 RepID=UPI0026302292|nr:hypothetical protein [uncultured Azohydromonas sp.]
MFDFLERVFVDTVAEIVTLPLQPVEAAFDLVAKVVDPDGDTLSDIRRESFPNSVFRLKD